MRLGLDFFVSRHRTSCCKVHTPPNTRKSRYYSLVSTIHSTSVAIPKGSEFIPTADRACMPRVGPKISTNKSEAPLITAGCCSKSAVQWTMPTTLTIRINLDQSPFSSWCMVFRSCMAQSLAAVYPSSTDKSFPSLPLTNVVSFRCGL